MTTRLAILLLAAVPARAAAQDAAPADTTTAACEDGVVSVVFVDNHSIFDTSDPDLDKRLSFVYRLANSLHVRTREDVIRREILVRPGDCYDPAMLEESERLLRGLDFLSRVDVFGLRQPDSTWHVIVDTQDEWSTRVDVRLALDDGLDFRGVRIGEFNVLGTGREVEFFLLERDANREYGVGYATPQLLGTRWDLDFSFGRTRAGSFARQSLAYPFVGEVGRWAARQGFRRDDRFFDYVIDGDDEEHVLLPTRDKGFDVAVVGRRGEIGRLTTFGAAISFVELTHPGGIGAAEHVQGDDFDDPTPLDPALAQPILRQMSELNSLRLLLLLGRRNVWWVKRQGLDALRGEQDVRLGNEVEVALGRSLPGRADDDEALGSLAFYSAAEMGELLLAGRLRADGRRDLDAGDGTEAWRDLFADAELLGYWRPSATARHTVVFRASGAGGWETRTPFQLTLGGDLGVRGYDRHRFPGGRRVLFTLEDRVYFGWPYPDVLDVGGTVFLDVGRVWPGDAPFGVDSGWKSAIGLGLRGSFPAGGRNTYRVDLAFPLEHGAGLKDVRLVVSVGELLGLASDARDGRLREARSIRGAGDLFHFPR